LPEAVTAEVMFWHRLVYSGASGSSGVVANWYMDNGRTLGGKDTRPDSGEWVQGFSGAASISAGTHTIFMQVYLAPSTPEQLELHFDDFALRPVGDGPVC